MILRLTQIVYRLNVGDMICSYWTINPVHYWRKDHSMRSVVCCMVLSCLLLLHVGCAPNFAREAPFKKGDNAPQFSAKDMDGNEFSSEGLKGKYVLLCFWTAGCKFCDDDHPALRKLREKHSDEDLVILGVNVYDDRDTAVSYLKAKNLPWPQILDKTENNAEIEDKYKINSLPTYVLIDQKGSIIGYQISKVPGIPL